VTTRRCTSPPPLASSTRRRGQSIHNKDLDEDVCTIPDNYNDRRDANSKSNDEPLRQRSRKAMGKWLSEDSFTSTLGNQVVATQAIPTSVQPVHPEHREVNTLSEEEDECELAPLASKKLSN